MVVAGVEALGGPGLDFRGSGRANPRALPGPKPRCRGYVIFAGFGAVTAGLGIILLLAYNWQAIPRGGKLAIVFAGLMMLHRVGIWLFQRGERWQAGEAVCLLGSMLFGSGIWLIAQIYNIQEHYQMLPDLGVGGAAAGLGHHLRWSGTSGCHGSRYLGLLRKLGI